MCVDTAEGTLPLSDRFGGLPSSVQSGKWSAKNTETREDLRRHSRCCVGLSLTLVSKPNGVWTVYGGVFKEALSSSAATEGLAYPDDTLLFS